MLRARLELTAALLGFLILLTEFGCALYCVVSTHRGPRFPSGSISLGPLSRSMNVGFHYPTALLGLACLIGGVVLYRAFRGRWTWSGNLAALSPLAAFLVSYRPPVSVDIYLSDMLTLPYGAPLLWTRLEGGAPASIALQIVLYVAAAAYALAIVLALPHRDGPRQEVTTVRPSAP
jgi:hypothetical protein